MPTDQFSAEADFSNLITELYKQTEAWNKSTGAVDKNVNATIQWVKAANSYIARLKNVTTEINKGVTATVNLNKAREVTSVRIRDNTAALEAQRQKLVQVSQAQVIARQKALDASRAQSASAFMAIRAGVSTVGASPRELAAMQAQEAALQRLMDQHRIAGRFVEQVWRDVSRGNLQRYGNNLDLIKARLLEVQKAQRNLGAEARKAAQQAATGARKVATATQEAADKSQELLISWRSFARLLAVQLIHRAVASLTRSIRAGVEASTELQIRISEIRTLAQENQLAFGRWAEGVREVADAYGLTTLDAAEAAYQALSNQVVKGAESFEFLNTAARLSIATVSTMTESVNALSSVINAFKLPVSEAEQIAAALFGTVEKGRVRLGQMSNAIGDVSLLSAQLNIRFEEMAAAFQTLTVQGIPPHRALTQLRGILIKLLKPTTDMKNLFSDLGVTTAAEAIEIHKLGGFLKIIQERTGGAADQVALLVPRVRGLAGTMGILNKGLELYDKNLQNTTDITEKFNNAVSIGVESAGKQLQIEVQKIKSYFQKDIGFTILETVASITSSFGGLSEVVKGLAKLITVVLIPAIIGLTYQLGIMAKTATLAFAGIAGSVGIVSAAIIGATFYVLNFYKQLVAQEVKARQQWEASWKQRREMARKQIVSLVSEINDLIDEQNKETLRSSLKAVGAYRTFAQSIYDESKKLGELVKKDVQEVTKVLNENISKFTKAATKAQKEVDAALEASKNLRERRLTQVFELQLEDASPAKQAELIRKRVIELEKQRQKATTVDEAVKVQNKLLDLIGRRGDLDRDNEKQRLENADKRAKIDEKINKEKNKFAKINLRLDQQINKAVEKGDKEKADILRSTQTAKVSDFRTTIQNLEKEKAKIIDIRFERLDTIKRLAVAEEKFQNQLRKLHDNAAAAQEQAAEKATQAELRRIDLVAAHREFAATTLQSILQLDQGERVTAQFEERQKALDRLIELRRKEAGGDESVQRLIKRRQDEEIAYQNRLRAIKIKDAQTALQDITEQRKAQLAAIEEAVASRAEVIAGLIKEREAATKAASERGGPTAGEALYNQLFPEVKQKLLKDLTDDQVVILKNLDQLRNAEANRAETVNEAATSTKNLATNMDLLNTAIKNALRTISIELGQVDVIKRTAEEITRTVPQTPKAAGGYMLGQDSVPALLSPGEFVVNAASSRKFYSQLVSMNNSARFANGGPVGGQTVNTGDFNISLESSGSEHVDIVRIGKLLRRAIRRGTVCLS